MVRLGLPNRWSILLTFKNLMALSGTNPFSAPQGFFDNSTERLLQSHWPRNDLQVGVLSHHGHPIGHLLSWRLPMPHYYFDIKDGHRLVDPSGLNFKTDDDAIARAEAIAIVVSIDKPEVDPKRHIAVLNGSREEIFIMPVYSKPSMSTT
jgi:hypothetical protein